MTLNNILSNGSNGPDDKEKKVKEFNELKKLLNVNDTVSEHEIIATCRILKHMQNQLDISSLTPNHELVSLYNKLKEIRAIFDLETNNFKQLNELLIEITTVREMANFAEDKPLADLLFALRGKNISSYGIGKNSLLEKLLRYYLEK